MARTKKKVLTIRTSVEVKALLKLSAERERRSASSMIEVLVLSYAEAHGLAVPASNQPETTGSITIKKANASE
ncbi:hypothetical protein [Thiocapsa bogorovii]|jgi:hypothetical protein|uniref:hypothetical protein n=1 Tax=Thiocapsa bogorovii TaxID=521689 RepID=UPI001E4F60F8|nr:hypothetical protein [Thiocapsa bogorovii]UHD18311.1 hypothetical protein LT988_09870 [Thiocapsa bogorovii]